MITDFFAYQQRRLDILKFWGVGNVVVGAAAAICPEPVVRHIGLQSIGWGAIDAALAIAGQRSAGAKARQLAQGELAASHVDEEVRHLHRLVLVNAGLDAGYVVGGLWLFITAGQRRHRQGMGLGIMAQGLFLLLYDGFLAREIEHRYADALLPTP